MKIRPHIPNVITLFRILATAFLFWLPPFEVAFYVVYTVAGLSDALDGWLARRLGMTSDLGARLDSIADLLLYAVMLVKILPELIRLLPGVIWLAVVAILLVRVGAYVVAAVKYHRFAALHTWMNKATGLLLFATPYLIGLPVFEAFCWTVCVVALMASGEELVMHLTQKAYSAEVKTIFYGRKRV